MRKWIALIKKDISLDITAIYGISNLPNLSFIAADSSQDNY